MGDKNPIRTLGDYSKPSHEGYRNTIELPVGNNVVPLRSDTIRLVQNGCSFYGLRSEDLNQHLRNFLKLVDSPELDGDNMERTQGLVSEFMASQVARLSKFEADFKQQQREMTNKIDTVLKAITDQIASTLPSDTVKNPKLGTHPISSTCSYPTMDPQCSIQIHSSINTITIHPKQQSDSHNRTKEKKEKEKGNPENHLDSPTPPDPSILFITKKVLIFNSLFESLGLVPPIAQR
ncbi:hypothetical protein Tco_0802118 [Tanacetum coccineum]|uniref:MAK10-like protein n=1 Tax=Tanacetum coccineum TaxID=301880 RepID=A0ABQ4ZYT2_9ASTR